MEKTDRIVGDSIKASINNLLAKDTFWVILLSIITFIVCSWYIPQRTTILLSSDEFSLYGQAAYFAGFDWSELISAIDRHTQFGYPLVFILPFFLIFGDNILAVYLASLYANALLAASLVPFTYYILKQWGIKNLKDDWIYIPVILMISLAACVVAYAHLGLSEVLMIVLVFALTATLLRIKEKGANYKLSMLFAFLLVYGFSCHMRFIGVTISGALVFLLMALMKKVKARYLISFIGMFVGAFIVSSYLTDYLISVLWSNAATNFIDGAGSIYIIDSVVSESSVVEQVRNSLYIFFWEGALAAFFRVICGQLWYLGLASFLLVYFGIYAYIKELFHKFKERIRQKKYLELDYSMIFVMLGFTATFLISTVPGLAGGYIGYSIRGDYLIYGRYNSLVFLPVILYAMHTIIEKKGKFNISLISIPIGYVILSIYVAYIHELISPRDETIILLFNVINYSLLYSIPYNSIVAIAGFILVAVSCYFFKKRIFLCIVLILLTVFNIVSGHYFIRRDVLPLDDSFISLNELNEIKNEDNAYMYRISIPVRNFSKMRMSLPRTDVSHIDSFDEIKDNNVILLMEHQHLFTPEVLGRLSITNMLYTDKLIVALEYDIDNAAGSITLPMDIFRSQNGDIEGGSIISNGSLGHLIFGPYITLEPGEYVLTADLTLLENRNTLEKISEADITIGPDMRILAEQDIELKDFVDNRYFLEFRVEIEETSGSFQIRILAEDGVILQVSRITIALVQPHAHIEIME